jgi:hypothetical protein
MSQAILSTAGTLAHGSKFCPPSLEHGALRFAVEIMQNDKRRRIQDRAKVRKSPISRLCILPLRTVDEEEVDMREAIENKLGDRSVIPPADPGPIRYWCIQ